MAPSATSVLYEPLIERDLGAIAAAARAFAAEHSADELWVAITRFAVLAYAPSQHAKRAVMACRAAHQVRAEVGGRWFDLIVECARYASASRQPWSEPPLLDPPELDASVQYDMDELNAALAAGDRPRAERWLAARIDDAEKDLRAVARGDALLMLDAALALEPLLGSKGRYALLRMPLAELLAGADRDEPSDSIDRLIQRVVDEKGSIDSVRAVFLSVAAHPDVAPGEQESSIRLEPYELARDYAQTLIAHAVAPRLPSSVDAERFLEAVHQNLEHGESFAEWSFA